MTPLASTLFLLLCALLMPFILLAVLRSMDPSLQLDAFETTREELGFAPGSSQHHTARLTVLPDWAPRREGVTMHRERDGETWNVWMVPNPQDPDQRILFVVEVATPNALRGASSRLALDYTLPFPAHQQDARVSIAEGASLELPPGDMACMWHEDAEQHASWRHLFTPGQHCTQLCEVRLRRDAARFVFALHHRVQHDPHVNSLEELFTSCVMHVEALLTHFSSDSVQNTRTFLATMLPRRDISAQTRRTLAARLFTNAQHRRIHAEVVREAIARRDFLTINAAKRHDIAAVRVLPRADALLDAAMEALHHADPAEREEAAKFLLSHPPEPDRAAPLGRAIHGSSLQPQTRRKLKKLHRQLAAADDRLAQRGSLSVAEASEEAGSLTITEARDGELTEV